MIKKLGVLFLCFFLAACESTSIRTQASPLTSFDPAGTIHVESVPDRTITAQKIDLAIKEALIEHGYKLADTKEQADYILSWEKQERAHYVDRSFSMPVTETSHGLVDGKPVTFTHQTHRQERTRDLVASTRFFVWVQEKDSGLVVWEGEAITVPQTLRDRPETLIQPLIGYLGQDHTR